MYSPDPPLAWLTLLLLSVLFRNTISDDELLLSMICASDPIAFVNVLLVTVTFITAELLACMLSESFPEEPIFPKEVLLIVRRFSVPDVLTIRRLSE